MGKVDRVSSILFMLLGIMVIFGSYRLGLGVAHRPGPGFLTFWCGIILWGLSLLLLFRAVMSLRIEKGKKLSQLWLGVTWWKPICLVVALIVYTLALEYLGFLLATIAFLLFLFKAVEPETWPKAILNAVVAAGICYLLFGIWLQVQLPKGFIENLLS